MATKGEFLRYGKGDNARALRIEEVTETHARCVDQNGSAYVLDLSEVDGIPRKQKALKRLKLPKSAKPGRKAWPKI